MHRGYIDSLSRGRGLAGHLPPGRDRPVASADGSSVVDAVLIVTGGDDVDPAFYGDSGAAASEDPDLERDRGRGRSGPRGACARADRCWGSAGHPGAGRGHGGIARRRPPARPASPGHWMEQRQYRAGSRREGRARFGVRHRCSAGGTGELHPPPGASRSRRGPGGDGLAPDGVIEAIEGPGALGIQWHPERLASSDERHLGPFRWLVDSDRCCCRPGDWGRCRPSGCGGDWRQ